MKLKATIKSNFDWMSNPQYLAQVGHFFGAFFVIIIPSTIVMLMEWPLWYTGIWFGIGVAAASFKEFVFDTSSWGEGDSWSDSLMDWCFYILGVGVGLGITKLFYCLLKMLLARHGVV